VPDALAILHAVSTARITRIERESRFEAARELLIVRLGQARRDDGWFRAPGVVARFQGRDVEVRFPGGPSGGVARAAARLRTGGAFSARPRWRVLRWLGFRYLALRGEAPPETVRAQVERLLRDHGAWRVAVQDGLVRADLSWDPLVPEPERVVTVLERLARIALDLEDVAAAARAESGGKLLCPFCRSPIGESAPLARCEACATPYHPSCFEEHGGCVIYGCRNRTARSTSGRLPDVKDA
jgi:hypothetical protein